jgi:hypothetical protein
MKKAGHPKGGPPFSPTPEKRAKGDEQDEHKRNPAAPTPKGPMLRVTAVCATEETGVYGLATESAVEAGVDILGGHFHQNRVAVGVSHGAAMYAPRGFEFDGFPEIWPKISFCIHVTPSLLLNRVLSLD